MRFISGGRGIVGSIVLLIPVYLLALHRLPLSVFWSPDEGGKFLQMSGYKVGALLTYELPYPGKIRDPALHFYPTNHIYPQLLPGHRVKFGDAAAFPLLSIAPYRLFSLPGLYVGPFACGLLTALLSGLLANRVTPGAGPFVVIVVGLASPIFFYSLLFWEHTMAVCLCMGAMWLIMGMVDGAPSRRALRGLIVIMLLALAVALRFEMLIFIVSLLLALSLTLLVGDEKNQCLNTNAPNRRVLLWGGVVTAILLFALAPLLPQILGGSSSFPSIGFLLPRAWARIQDPSVWAQLPSHLSHWLVNDPAAFGPQMSPAWSWTGNAGLLLCLLSLVSPRRLRPVTFMTGALLVALMSLHVLMLGARYRTIHSVFLPAPYLVAGVLCVPYLRQRKSSGIRLLISVSFIYLILHMLVCLATDVDGSVAGLEWGPRYILLIFPLMAILAVAGFRTLWVEVPTLPARFAFAMSGAVLLLIGLAFQVRGIGELQTTKRDLICVQRAIEREGLPVVTDLWWLPGSLGPCFAKNEIYTLAAQADFEVWMHQIGHKLDRFMYVSYGRFEPDRANPGVGHISLVQRKVVSGMTFSTYVSAGEPR